MNNETIQLRNLSIGYQTRHGVGVLKSVVDVRKYNQKLGFSQKWVTDFVYRVVMLAKKEKQPKEQ